MEKTIKYIQAKKWQIHIEGRELHIFNHNSHLADPNMVVARLSKLASSEGASLENHFEEVERGHTLIRFRAITAQGEEFLGKLNDHLNDKPKGKRIKFRGFAKGIWAQRWNYIQKEGRLRFISTVYGNPKPTPVTTALRELARSYKLGVGKGKDIEIEVKNVGNVAYKGRTDEGKALLRLLNRFFSKADYLEGLKRRQLLFEKRASSKSQTPTE
ncbi:MAG: hypothetical protein AABX01_03150 [Candidatus Micrarchaeota archaeon]